MGSVAEKSRLFNIGDHVLEINNKSTISITQGILKLRTEVCVCVCGGGGGGGSGISQTIPLSRAPRNLPPDSAYAFLFKAVVNPDIFPFKAVVKERQKTGPLILSPSECSDTDTFLNQGGKTFDYGTLRILCIVYDMTYMTYGILSIWHATYKTYYVYGIGYNNIVFN